jgi:hypothetical protein
MDNFLPDCIRDTLDDLRLVACQHPIDIQQNALRMLTKHGRAWLADRLNNQSTIVKWSYYQFRVIFLIETGHPRGPCRHLAAAVIGQVIPTEEAVWQVAQAVGFVRGAHCETWVDEPDFKIHLRQPIGAVGEVAA